MVTATFSITRTRELLPIQLLYGSKTSPSILVVSFPSDFVIHANEKYSKKKNVFNMLRNAITPYIEGQRITLTLEFDFDF